MCSWFIHNLVCSLFDPTAPVSGYFIQGNVSCLDNSYHRGGLASFLKRKERFCTTLCLYSSKGGVKVLLCYQLPARGRCLDTGMENFKQYPVPIYTGDFFFFFFLMRCWQEMKSLPEFNQSRGQILLHVFNGPEESGKLVILNVKPLTFHNVLCVLNLIPYIQDRRRYRPSFHT